MDPTLVRGGIYALSASTRTNSCSPALWPTGALGNAMVVVKDDVITTTVPHFDERTGGFITVRVDKLQSSDGYAAVFEVNPLPLPRCQGRFHSRRVLTETKDDGFVVRDQISYEVPCAPAPSDLSLPQASCSIEQELHYDLTTACAAPCEVKARRKNELYCSCDDAT